MRFDDHIRSQLAALHASGLHRRLVTLDSPTAGLLNLQGRSFIHLAGNDYLGLATHPALAQAVADGARAWGTGAGASRLVTGHLAVHRDAEQALANLVGFPSALLFPTGYMANVGTVQALAGPGDLVLSDALNHASLIDGCRLSGARILVYPHRDVARARQLLSEHRGQFRATLLVTDAIFSMDATVAPLPELRALTHEFDAGLLVDEAHALGIAGPEGRGLCAQFQIQPDVVIGTLGKSLGLMGAFAAARPDVVDLLLNRARSFVFGTGLSPAIAAAVPVAVDLLLAAHEPRATLTRATHSLAQGIAAKGYDLRAGTGPILPVWLGSPERAVALADLLWERGVLARAIRPPTVPAGTSRVRIVPSAHTTADLVLRALEAFPDAPADLPDPVRA